MEIQTEIFDYAVTLMGVTITSQLPTGNGYALQITPSNEERIFLDGNADSNLTLLLLGKNTNQLTVADTLYSICNKLRKQKVFEHNVNDVTIDTEPSLVSKEGDYWIWSCILTFKFRTGGK